MENGREKTSGDADQLGGIAGVRTVKPSEPAIRLTDTARVALEIDTSIYSMDAILRATYKFTDRCYVLLHSNDLPNRCVAHLTAKTAGVNLSALAGEFGNELLDQQLRERLEHQFGPVRSLIVAQAFAEGNLLDRDREDGDYTADPRGIGGPPR
jgi:His-Xaa-Ser system protein HxsD